MFSRGIEVEQGWKWVNSTILLILQTTTTKIKAYNNNWNYPVSEFNTSLNIFSLRYSRYLKNINLLEPSNEW